MKPIQFKEQNVTFAENQDEYIALPAFYLNGEVVTCWKASWKDRLRILFVGRIWLHILKFDNPLQPIYMQATYPFENSGDNNKS